MMALPERVDGPLIQAAGIVSGQRIRIMKTGKSLAELAAELQRQTETRKDYIAPQAVTEAVVVDGVVKLAGFNGDAFEIRPHAHAQLSQALSIPKAYYDRMAAEEPALLAQNVNTWFQREPDAKRMIRTLDGSVRAVLSPKFRPLDNFDLAQAILPTLIERKIQIASCELTETRMYIKGILPELSDELPAGLSYGTGHHNIATDRGRVVAAIVISNSDVGAGSLRMEPSVFTTWCTNLAIMKQAAMRKYHVGRANAGDGDTWEVLHDDTRAADDRAFWLKVRDVTMAAFDEKIFRAAVERMRLAGQAPIKSDNLSAVVSKAVEVLALPAATSNGILSFLAKGGDITQWGLSSAITRVANDYADYEGATVLERAGGEVLELPAGSWRAISEAA